MSEPIPESVPTSADPRSKRPLKRRALTPVSEQATEIQTLFKDPSKDIKIPDPSKKKTSASLPAPPEIVANVQGSSAGAGSGEFHVYKASRRREYERVKLMDEELKKEKADEEYQRKLEEAKRRDEEKTDKNRKRREKRKATKKKVQGGAKQNANGAEKMDVDGAEATKPTLPQVKVTMDGSTNENGSSGEPQQTQEHTEPGVIIYDED